MKFFTDTREFVFQDPAQYPSKMPIQKNQVLDRTANNKLQVENFGESIKERHLYFSDMSLTDYSGLVDWFDNVSDGAANIFNFEDEKGEIYSVRITSNIYDFPETHYQLFSGTLILEIIQ